MKCSFLKTLFFALLAALALFGCNDDKEPLPPEVSPPVVNVNGIPAEGFSFLYFEETSKSFTVESNSPWEIKKTDGWFTVTPYKGNAGTIEVKVFVAGNDDIARSGTFTVTANSGTLLKPVEVSKTFTVSQGAYNDAGISITDLASTDIMFEAGASPLTFTMLAAFPWSIELSNNDWVTVSPASGAGGQSVTITVTPAANTVAEPRECTLTITCTDPQNPTNTDSKVIELRQRPFYEWDTNLAEGAVLLEDDFNWITPLWSATNSRYGFPTVSLGTPDVTGSNEYALSTAPLSTEMANRGWTFTSAYARYEGWVKLGVAASMGRIITPALSAIAPGKVVNLLVSFDGSVYASATGNSDATTGSNVFSVSVTGEGTINDTDEQSMDFPLLSHFAFDRYFFLVRGASATTQIQIGATTASANRRFIVDNVKIERVSNFDPELPPTESVELPLDFEVDHFGRAALVSPLGASLRYSIRVNRAWTATPSDSWLRFTQVQGGGNGTATGSSGNGGSVAGGVGSAIANAIVYNHCFIAVDPNPTAETRTATVTIASGTTTVTTFSITQAAGTPAADNITLTGITNDKIELAAESPSIVLFKVNATSAWDIAYTDTWYTIVPVAGEPDKDVDVVLVPTTNSGVARSGSFTITAGAATTIVTVEQQGGQETIVEGLPASWLLPQKEGIAAAGGTNGDFTDYVANDGSANLGMDHWWVKSDDSHSIIRASRAVATNSNQNNMSYTTTNPADGDRILMYGMMKNDYWQMEIPTLGLAAGTSLRVEGGMQSSAAGPRYVMLEYSTDQTTWVPVNAKSVPEIPDDSYTVMLPSAAFQAIDETFTISSAIPEGKFYIRLRISSTISTRAGSGTSGVTDPATANGTNRLCRPQYTGNADKKPIMKVTKL